MKSLASVRDAIDIYEDRLDSDYINEIGPNLNFKTKNLVKNKVGRVFPMAISSEFRT